MELLYLVDADDMVLGSVERSKAHAEEALHRAGLLFLSHPDGKVLVQQRSHTKETFPGLYDASVSFHVTFGESYAEAASRELMEEAGVSAPMSYLGKFIHHDPPEHEIVAVFHCVSDSEIKVDPAESAGFEFLDIADVDRIVSSGRITPWFRDGWKVARPRLAGLS